MVRQQRQSLNRRVSRSRLRDYCCAVAVGLTALALAGCTSTKSAYEILFEEQHDYHDEHQAHLLAEHTNALAEEAWLSAVGPGNCPSVHYERGFKEGFADYLQFGGTGNPPPLPPRDYWQREYQTPVGQQLINDWFAGFHLGAETAKLSGHREQITVPVAGWGHAHSVMQEVHPHHEFPTHHEVPHIQPGPSVLHRPELERLPPAPTAEELPAEEIDDDPPAPETVDEVPPEEVVPQPPAARGEDLLDAASRNFEPSPIELRRADQPDAGTSSPDAGDSSLSWPTFDGFQETSDRRAVDNEPESWAPGSTSGTLVERGPELRWSNRSDNTAIESGLLQSILRHDAGWRPGSTNVQPNSTE